MRPYMLWLTRVYGRSIVGYGTAFLAWPNVLDDWLRRCAEDRFRRGYYPRPEQYGISRAYYRALRKSRPTESQLGADALLAAHHRARAAGQGGR